jgi:hypothetical protein
MAFKKIDSASLARQRQEDQAFEDLVRADTALVEALRERAPDLSERENSLVQMTWARRVGIGLPASDPQRKWLRDIATKLDIAV